MQCQYSIYACHDHFSFFFLSSFNGKPRAKGIHHRCMTVNAQLSSSSLWSWQASPQDPTTELPTLSRDSPGTIYPFRDSPFALDYLPHFQDSLALQVIRPFRDTPTFSSFYALSTYPVYFRRNSTLLLNKF